ncbi:MULTISPECIES: hypothetical protein [Rhizobium]|uniref:Uncharacterized protein n=1 Tax=Rhizobium rhizoryzae TaxID=451876 RepID=A0A7W6PP32_9HYPH|nr:MULTISPECIES: hypothetical protein [Rhizobium]MBB4142630.1 hypothetical protein [Rhizobium rhizoryzae]
MSQNATQTLNPKTAELHAPLRPLGIKAVVAAALMLKRNVLKKA